jgi:hypothetical protein|tara:strand:- start:428 stop:646 length:219 start_codon:yes stop_codon:yes gene_type:complete
MIKVFLFMYICSTTPGNECKLIDIEINQFNDMYECTLSGYQQSKDIILELNRKFVNEHGAHTKFMCIPQPTV